MAIQNVTTRTGSILDPATGNQIDVIPGSVADIGTGGTMPTQPAPGTTWADGLPSLPSLPSLPTAVQTGIQQASSAVSSGANAVTNAATKAFSPVALFFGINLEDVVFVLLGVILIAAAAFSFKPVNDAVVKPVTKAAKGAVKDAVTAAVVAP